MRPRPKRRWRVSPVDLFPFLSIFLCIFGVLSFLQILMASSGTKRIVLVGEGRQGLRVAYQIYCLPEGFVTIPPVEGLGALEHVSRGATKLWLRTTRRDRVRQRTQLASSTVRLKQGAAILDVAGIKALLDEIEEVNRIARQNHHLYEEFVLFGAFPGGGPNYHRFRSLLATSKYQKIRSGLEALDSDFNITPPSVAKSSL